MAWSPPELGPAARTLGALGLLTLALPANLAVTGAALVRRMRSGGATSVSSSPRTVLISGGKMTKALVLARSFHAAGHRVVLVEQHKYRFTGHRFSRAVDAFHVVPPPQAPGYAEALLQIVLDEKVDVYVPVCSPASSLYDARAAPLLAQHCEVLHGDADTIAAVDDKHAFSVLAAGFGLPVPDAHRMTSAQQVADFDFAARKDTYILKSIAYDPVNRLDLTVLPRPTRAATAEFARSKPISPDNPWILQALVEGTEYCTHATVRNGRVQVYACCESSAFQVNYAWVDRPRIEAWVRDFLEKVGGSGQYSLDVIETADGRVFPIECNPRTHSAISVFRDHPGLADAYLQDGATPVQRPAPGARPSYWLYHEVWRLLRGPQRRQRLQVIRAGRDAVFDWDDPLPFLLLHHLHIPKLLLGNLLRGKPWNRIDFNIGKLVEPAGD
ncbi:hypothetical protein LWF15_19170 [Kineosporia rhizophila]|uniref:hypothetical protein n=1 Tax=Kineosporia rhizophila TaxID=84633 RepID=UPI001E5D3E48|nr:hypothetical protein [Kineosporia rhizophila]